MTGLTDDGATIAILKRYPHLRWWSRENKGQYATMNEGLEAAKGEFVCFISADDLLAPGAVKIAIKHLMQHPELDGLYGRALIIDIDRNHIGNKYLFRGCLLSSILIYATYFIVHSTSTRSNLSTKDYNLILVIVITAIMIGLSY